MNLVLNSSSGGYPAQVTVFDDIGSLGHLLFGFLAGSGAVTSKTAIALLAGFIGYQVSQAQAGEPWSRTGGEFIEFALGMLGGMSMREVTG